MTTGPVLRLSTDEVWSALEDVNPVDLLAEELIDRAVSGERSPAPPVGRLMRWPADPVGPMCLGSARDGLAAGTSDEGLTVFEATDTGARCLFPTATLQVCRAATLAALAAQELVTPRVVTATFLGSGTAGQLLFAVVARHVPDVSHVSVCARPGDQGVPLEPRLLDQLDLAGIDVSVAVDAADAVFGANLIIAAETVPGRLDIKRLASGAVLVNAAGRDLPEHLIEGFDHVFVDDLGLLDTNRHRGFVAMHLAGDGAPGTRLGRGIAWHRTRRIEADLGQVLTGQHPGREDIDDVVLVELLGAAALDVSLAGELHRAACRRGLGVRLDEEPWRSDAAGTPKC